MNNAFFYESKNGKIIIIENGTAITRLYFGETIPHDVNVIETPLLKKAFKQLKEYLDGERKIFDLPIAPQGTEFQHKVWRVLQKIPYGKVCSYKDIAEKIGSKNAARAVGIANSKNPILILIPCHRIIGASGDLAGYAGGLALKEKLLNMEKQNASR